MASFVAKLSLVAVMASANSPIPDGLFDLLNPPTTSTPEMPAAEDMLAFLQEIYNGARTEVCELE